jgi:diadenosine tetraphosphate (Ap4A) HIT family hydrolase
MKAASRHALLEPRLLAWSGVGRVPQPRPGRRGYTLVFWHGRHAADPTDLTEEEACGFASEVRLVSLGIERAYRPAKLNYLTLGNALPHLHTHIVPRYTDDPDPGRPPRSMMADQQWPPMPDDQYAIELDELRAAIEAARGSDSRLRAQPPHR